MKNLAMGAQRRVRSDVPRPRPTLIQGCAIPRPDSVVRYKDVTADELFEVARLVVAAEIAKIHTIEWTPQLLGFLPIVARRGTSDRVRQPNRAARGRIALDDFDAGEDDVNRRRTRVGVHDRAPS